MQKQLTTDQTQALDRLLSFAKSTDRIFTLEGFAGVGKTTVMAEYAKELLDRGTPVVLTSPTNKATRVLSDMSRYTGLRDVKCKTIYSLLGLKLDNNSELRRVNYDAASPYEEFKKGVIIVDEASMVSLDLFHFLTKDVLDRYPELRICFVGDPMQLPPVGEKEAMPFSGDFPSFRLDKIVRQAEKNPIIRLTAAIRQSIQDGTMPAFENDVLGGRDGVFVVNAKTFSRWLVQHFSSPAYAHNVNECRAIAWRNLTVDSYNGDIRRAIYGRDVARQKYIVGERVTAVSPVMALTEDPNKTEIVLTTDEEATVLDIEEERHPLYPAAAAYAVRIERDDGAQFTVYTSTPESIGWVAQTVRDKKAEALEDRRKWFFYYKFVEHFADIKVYGNRVSPQNLRPAHTLTAHKSQGSTFNRAFVDAADILANQNRVEALKCLYVAVSRARKAVVVMAGN